MIAGNHLRFPNNIPGLGLAGIYNISNTFTNPSLSNSTSSPTMIGMHRNIPMNNNRSQYNIYAHHLPNFDPSSL